MIRSFPPIVTDVVVVRVDETLLDMILLVSYEIVAIIGSPSILLGHHYLCVSSVSNAQNARSRLDKPGHHILYCTCSRGTVDWTVLVESNGCYYNFKILYPRAAPKSYHPVAVGLQR